MEGYEMYTKIQTRKKMRYSQRQTAEELEIDRGTVKKYWNMSEEEYAEYRIESKERNKIVEPYREIITGYLEKYRNITSAVIYDNLLEGEEGFKPSKRSVQLYVANLREELGIERAVKIRQYNEVAEMPPGYQAQVDMGEKVMVDMYGKKVKIYIFAMVLSNSRKKYVYFQDRKFTAETFVKGHDMAFRYYGGRTEEIVYDQDRVMAVSENAGELILTEKFESYRGYAGFNVRLCRAYDPESKGKIEAVIKYVKNNFLGFRVYNGLSRLNSEGMAWLERCANGQKHETTKMIPNRMYMEEMKYMKAVPELSEPELPRVAIVRKTNVIHYRQNRYEVPKGTYYPGRKAEIQTDMAEEKVTFYDAGTQELLAEHKICGEIGKLVRLPKNANRYKEVRYEALIIKVRKGFENVGRAEEYINKIVSKYPRYVRDQLRIISMMQEKYSKKELTNALDYCFEREMYSASDFRDTLEYFKREQATENKQTADLPAKYAVVKAQTRPVSMYNAAMRGGENK
jgi:transposase